MTRPVAAFQKYSSLAFRLQISSLIGQFSASEPVFVIIDVRPGVEGLPTTAYEAVEEVEADGKEIQRVFKHIKCSVEAEEAEEVTIFLYFSSSI
jgi:26S proteasome regulatory subunit N8